MTPTCSLKSCNDPAHRQTEDGLWFCEEHREEYEAEMRKPYSDLDEHGRSKAVMRNARAM